MARPKATNNKVEINSKRYIVSKTDADGIIQYGNDYFTEISGYSEEELIGKSHNIIRHPDMPKLAFKMMWDRISKGDNFIAVVKNLTKDGSYYWVITDFEPKMDSITNEPVSYTAFRKAAPQKVINKIEPIYKKLLELENEGGMKESEKFLREFLDEKNTTYDKYINDVVGNNGLFKIFFTAMKKIFS